MLLERCHPEQRSCDVGGGASSLLCHTLPPALCQDLRFYVGFAFKFQLFTYFVQVNDLNCKKEELEALEDCISDLKRENGKIVSSS